MSTEAQAQAPTYEFNPAEALKALDKMEAFAREDSVFVPTDFSKHAQAYIRAYVSRRWNEYMSESVLPEIETMRTYLNNEKPPAFKEFQTLIYFKHKARAFERTCDSIDYLIKQRYHPEELMDDHENADIEDDEERWERHHYLDADGNPLPPPPTKNPVELDPQWADVDEYAREYALIAFARKLGDLYEFAKGEENVIRSNQSIRARRKERAERGVKQIVNNTGNRYLFKEIPVADPVPDGWREANY